ncbi:MAG: hypothetical protein IH571_04280 [Acholeplasmataceae bacterium]|nr:hypothetical protein [Acholeplasmataceae bacterium]
MKFKIIQAGIQLLIVISFFFNLFNTQHSLLGDQSETITIKTPISGFQALIDGSFFVFGNILIWALLLASAYHLLSQIMTFAYPDLYVKLETSLTIVINLQIFFGLFVVTLMGRFLEIPGMVMIALIIAGAFLRYKFKT